MRAQPTELDRLLCNIRACRTCVESPDGKPLPHEPRPVLRVSPTARIAVCSQAPGTRVHASGIPFTDSSGDRLRDWMGVESAGVLRRAPPRHHPMGFCFPGQDANGADLPPRVECAKTLASFFVRAAATARTCALRRVYSQRWHLGDEAGNSLQATMLDWRKHLRRTTRPRILPLPHPSWRNNAWLKRNPWFEEELLPFSAARSASSS